jgi:hypothetical protein
MHRSSETIATIAAALAKAQLELTNPEKSLVATIRSPFPREPDRTFRYAPLSSGLDIIRKSLGRHEIATIQATAIDTEAGLLRLTTVLAHSSGEWISSEWPVCQISDIASAQRVGAALTYARRYALFALVGIAGEDDLNAPDLGAEPNPAPELPRTLDDRRSSEKVQAGQRTASRDRKPPGSSERSVLGEQLSASLRESLIQQMAATNSADEAAAWAHRSLPTKNTLTAADAKIVEERFAARLCAIGDHQQPDGPSNSPPAAGTPGGQRPDGPPHAVAGPSVIAGASTAGTPSKGTKKQSRSDAVGALGKAVRLRDKDHRRFILRQPCLVCGRVPSDSHHLTFTQPRALGRRVSDEFTVPVCRVHHRELHRSGDEAAWWRRLNIDPLPVALKLWQQSRADGELLASTQGGRQAQLAKTTDLSAQIGSDTSRDAKAHPERAA